jgi:DeoR/GlpR family transcriptional regulator of sugar metabolism
MSDIERGARRNSKRERHQQILDELQFMPVVRASELARRLGVHVETIRRDLDELHEVGKISRTYGGALPGSVAKEATLAERDGFLVAERTRIAELAASMISGGDVVMVDVGSTTTRFVRKLAAAGTAVRLITNSCTLVAAVGSHPQFKVTLCPGDYSASQDGVAGPETIQFLRNFYADKVVLSVGGVTEDGLYEYDPEFAWIKRTMIGCSRVRILMVDRSKLNKMAMARICGFSEINHLIVDGAIGEPLLHCINEARTQVHVA